jgi:hypothetical protein
MKKLLFALGSIAAMIIVSSCSADNIEDVKTENLINKKTVSPSATTNTVLQDTIPQTNQQPIDGGDPPRP